MLHRICLVLKIVLIVSAISIAKGQQQTGDSSTEITGEATNGLQPHILVEKYSSGWTVNIEIYAQSNFVENSWLKITNRVGSKLQVWSTNGIALQSTDPSVLAALCLPSKTAISDIFNHVHPIDRRGMQWWPGSGHKTVLGESAALAVFRLQNVFDVSLTNDVMLQITPLIYRVDTNKITAHLVEFPPVKMKLLSNGTVQEVRQ